MSKERGENLRVNNPLYVIDELNGLFGEIVSDQLGREADINLSEAPPKTGFDFGTNITRFAAQTGVKPQEISSLVANRILSEKPTSLIDEVEGMGPFINFRLNPSEFGNKVVNQILEMSDSYGKETIGQDQKVVVDMSSPNIAKRMNYGHLRSTIIGDSLAKIYKAEGYEVIRDNHLGDWGTQFGKLIVAIKRWGDESELLTSEDPVGILQDLYVKFHSEADMEKEILRTDAKQIIEDKGTVAIPNLDEAIETVSMQIMKRKSIDRSELNISTVIEDALDIVLESDLEREGRKWFLELEKGDKEARRIWELCVNLSLKEFDQIYKTLGVGFEESLGESFYEDMLESVIERVRNSQIGKMSDGALVIDMEDENLGVAIVQKSDGASVYMTRDLACAMYRQDKMEADKAIYVVGEDQKYYFRQLFEALKRLGYDIGENAEHVYFGLVRLPEGKMSTREGRVILLKDVIEEGFARVGEIIKEKNPELYGDEELRDTVIRQITVGALKWNDLSQDAKRSFVFNWDEALNLEGNSAPYVQYTAVRANSVLETSGRDIQEIVNSSNISENDYGEQPEKQLIMQLVNFPNAIREAQKDNNPSKIAIYVYELAKRFNSFYTKVPVLRSEDEQAVESRLKLIAASRQVISNALDLLGIEVPEKM